MSLCIVNNVFNLKRDIPYQCIKKYVYIIYFLFFFTFYIFCFFIFLFFYFLYFLFFYFLYFLFFYFLSFFCVFLALLEKLVIAIIVSGICPASYIAFHEKFWFFFGSRSNFFSLSIMIETLLVSCFWRGDAFDS